MTTFRITEKGGTEVTAWLTGLESKYHALYLERVTRVVQMLYDRVRQKLSGEVLATITGRLLNSIQQDVLDSPTLITGHVWSDGSAPYARIQEQGGTTRPHEIIVREAGALRFESSIGPVFAAVVNHPGSRMPPHEYLRGSFVEMRAQLRSIVKTGG